jgi:Holliday junction resolvase RusA-like endonuclease
MEFYIPAEPVPASRPRVTRAGFAYYAKPYTRFKTLLKDWWTSHYTADPMLGPVAVGCAFVATRPKKTVLAAPRPDVDNYVKALLDSMNGIVWKDDTQVVSLAAAKQWSTDAREAGIYVVIEPAA